MSIEALNKIQEAESQAEALRVDAMHEARDIIKGVEEAIGAENRQAMQLIRDSAQQVVADQRASTEDEIRALDLQRSSQREEIRRDVLGRVDAAGRRIFERIVGNGNR